MIHLLPFDQTIAGIGEDQSHNGCPLSEGCLILLAIHHESAVSGDRQYLFLRVDQLGCHSPRHCDAHSGKTVGDDAGIGFVTVVLSGNPHFMSAHIRDHDVIRTHKFPDIVQYFLWLHGKRGVIRIAFIFRHHFFPQFEKFFRLLFCVTAVQDLL